MGGDIFSKEDIFYTWWYVKVNKDNERMTKDVVFQNIETIMLSKPSKKDMSIVVLLLWWNEAYADVQSKF